MVTVQGAAAHVGQSLRPKTTGGGSGVGRMTFAPVPVCHAHNWQDSAFAGDWDRPSFSPVFPGPSAARSR